MAHHTQSCEQHGAGHGSNDDLPIRTDKPIHSGKVRAAGWLTAADSKRPSRRKSTWRRTLSCNHGDQRRISAYECIWRGKGMLGVPGKCGTQRHLKSLSAKEKGLADSHILEVPHPLVWVVQRAAPVMIEAIIRGYITGSMWRDYSKGSREFCGIDIPDGLKKDSKLPELLVTPSTKGLLTGIEGVPEIDDVNVSREVIAKNYAKFNFASADDIATYEKLLKEGFGVIRMRSMRRARSLSHQVRVWLRDAGRAEADLHGRWARPTRRVSGTARPIRRARSSRTQGGLSEDAGALP